MPDLIQLTDRSDLTAPLRRGLISCWTEAIGHDGGLDRRNLGPVLDTLLARMHPERERLFAALSGAAVLGWSILRRDANPTISHWGGISHLQIHPSHRKRGVATALMCHLRRTARDEMGMERLWLSACGGHGLENFYSRLGWKETGRWPRAPHEEVLMVLTPL